MFVPLVLYACTFQFALSLADATDMSLSRRASAGSEACELLQANLPGSVFFPGSSQYTADISHWTLSGTQNSTCSVEPQNVSDLVTIIKTVGNSTIRAPFAIKGGGHGFNLGFSSTLGVQVSMVNFKTVSYDASSSTVKVGAGLTWDQVYKQLEPLNVNVVGGRVTGVGVGGYTLGGGYSWLTDQYGLTIDNIISYDLVLPYGTFTTVTNTSDPDLFFGLKGGLNNFGAATAFTLKAYPQTQVWGGPITFSGHVSDLVQNATSQFSLTKTDPKAQIVVSNTVTDGELSITAYLFYDAPTKPAIFDAFLSIPSLARNVETRTILDFILASFGDGAPIGARSLQAMVPIIRYTPAILDFAISQVALVYDQAVAANCSVLTVSFSSEPFTSAFNHTTPSAYPHPIDRQVTPSTPNLSWSDPADDAYFADALANLTQSIQTVAVAEGQSSWDDTLYSNYVQATTPVGLLFGGTAAVQRLAGIRERVDTGNVMGLTGGFKF